MAFSFNEILSTDLGKILISVILGLGLSTIFRKVCNGRNCIIVRGPEPKSINGNIYKYDNSCYKYSSHITSCGKENIKIQK